MGSSILEPKRIKVSKQVAQVYDLEPDGSFGSIPFGEGAYGSLPKKKEKELRILQHNLDYYSFFLPKDYREQVLGDIYETESNTIKEVVGQFEICISE